MTSLPFIFLLALAAPADEVELESGTVVEGKVEDLGDSIRVVRSGFSVVYPKHLVRSIVYKKTSEEVYAEKAGALRDEDVEGHLALARWCLLKKLAAEARREFEKVVAVEPDHEEARAGLGQRLYQGRWMTEDEINEARGLVRHKGRWMTPEERDLEVALEEQKELDQRLLREVRSQMDRLRSSDEKKREEARAALAGIDDRYKAKAFLAALSSSYREVRGFAIDELGRMKENAAARPLARRVVWDDEEEFRGRALRSMLAIGHPDSALFLAPYLAEDSVSARIRCAEAMARFRDLRTVPALIATLEEAIETHRAMEQYGDQVTAVVNRTLILRNGTRITLPRVVRVQANAFDQKSRDKILEEQATLVATLRAVTGQAFGADPAAWRAWMREQK